MSTNQAPAPVGFPDRSGRLMVAGVFEIVLGGFCLLLATMMGALLAAQGHLQLQPFQGPSLPALLSSVVIYLLAAVVFVCVGIGLARARRWAWAMTVAWSWVWLVLGAVAVVLICLMGQGIWAATAEKGKLPPQAASAMRIASTVVFTCAYVGVPGILLALCHHKSVRATCERRDAKTRWTDRCPLPVLALSLMFAFSFLSMFSLAAYRWTFPLFGSSVSGATGAALAVLIAVVLAYLAWGTYRLQPAAWWCARPVCHRNRQRGGHVRGDGPGRDVQKNGNAGRSDRTDAEGRRSGHPVALGTVAGSGGRHRVARLPALPAALLFGAKVPAP